MSPAVQVFNFDSYDVRVVVDRKEWFVAKDVCECLGLSNSTNVHLQKINELHKGAYPVRTLGGLQNLSCVDEHGLYRLVMRSDKPEAERFQNWVYDEVLPAIRKTGRYEMPGLQTSTPTGLTDSLALAFGLIAQHVKGTEEELGAIRGQLQVVAQGLQGIQERQEIVVRQTVQSPLMTISQFLKEHGLELTKAEKMELGSKVKLVSLSKGYPESRTQPSAVYPRGINRYRRDVLEEVVTVS